MKDSLRLSVPPHITELIGTLEKAGHRAYVVGGAVRDLLLGRPPADWDIATDALPEEVKRIFPRHVPTGEKFGTISVAVTDEYGEQRLIEVTTFRSDGLYLDGRRPVRVSFGHTLSEDLARRDFTINALAWHPEEGLIDPYGGVVDLRRRLISAVGDPATRFQEDALRMLRAVRLAAQLRFRLSRSAGRAIRAHRELIRRVAAERIQQELAKLLVSEDPRRGIRLLRATGLLALLLPELLAGYGVRQNRFHAYSIYTHCLLALQHAPPRLDLRLAALFHDAGKAETQSVTEDGLVHFYGHDEASAEMAHQALTRLAFPQHLVAKVVLLIRHHMFHYTPQTSDAALRRLILKVGEANIYDLIALRQADAAAVGVPATAQARRGEIAQLKERIDRLLAQEHVWNLSALAVDGHDLMNEFGLPPGPLIGKLLQSLLEEVITDPSRNRKEVLLALAREKLPELTKGTKPERLSE